MRGHEKYPGVQIADAEACAHWAGKRLPTEAEWEFAARGGQTGLHYVWGTELKPGGKWPANIRQGTFPTRNTTAHSDIGAACEIPPPGIVCFGPLFHGKYQSETRPRITVNR